MPIYEYVCPECQNRFELLRSMSQADTPVSCPKCQAEGARRVLSLFASVSKRADGCTASVSGGGCGSCGGGSCASCHH